MKFKPLKFKFKFKKENIRNIQKRIPSIIARHFSTIVLSGAVLFLLIGLYYFYQNVYILTKADYEASVTVRKVDTELFQEILEFIEQSNKSNSGDISNPFGVVTTEIIE